MELLIVPIFFVIVAIVFLAMGHRMGRGQQPIPPIKPAWENLTNFLKKEPEPTPEEPAEKPFDPRTKF